MNDLSRVVLLAVLLLLQCWLTLMYSTLIRARKTQVRELAEQGNPSAKLTLRLSENPVQLLAAYQFWSILLVAGMASLGLWLFIPDTLAVLKKSGVPPENAEILTAALAFPLFSLIVTILGYQLPGAIANGRNERFAMLVSRPMSILVYSLTPLLTLLQMLSMRISRVVGVHVVSQVTEEEIKTLVDAGSETGTIDDEEKEMIFSVFKFGDTLAREVMVPRIDMVAMNIHTSLKEALDIIIKAGHSRIPVYEDSIDEIKGLLYAKDLLAVWQKGEETTHLAALLRAPYFVPESKKAADLLEEFQTRKVHLAIVVDEYGGTAGLVTLEDLLEEIVGEIRDEYDLLEEEDYQRISDTEYICDAGLDLDDLNELLEISLSTDESDTLGGYIFNVLGEVPEVGAKIEKEGVIMEVLTLNGRRIQKVRVTRVENTPVAAETVETE